MTAATREDEALIAPVLQTTWRFWAVAAGLATVSLVGLSAYLWQLKMGLGVTGLNRPVYWGVYITNFVFFIGISHAGTLISAILRLARAEWRRAITRSAEVITVLVLFFGIGNILIDMGRPDRLLNIIKHGRFQSPLLWDVTSVTMYLTCSSFYLYLPLIPDIAILRDRTSGLRRAFYRMLALGWQGTARQHRVLEILISVMAVVVIPVAVSVHTVVSFVFAMTIQPGWHSAIFGPYFVCGAIFSGIAALILAMAIIRQVYGLQNYLKPIHFNYLGVLLLVMTLLWFYFTFSEYLVTFYGHEPVHMAVWWAKISGPFAPAFWTMVACCFVVPLVILANRRTRTVKGTVIASSAVIVGMWLERWAIVVPSLSNPRLPGSEEHYFPSIVEWSIFAGCVATFILLYMVFTKIFPIVSIWEIREGREEAVKEVVERVKSYLPTRAAVIAILVLGAGVAQAGEPARGDVRRGWQVFISKTCVHCHAIWGRGGEIGPDLGRTRAGGLTDSELAAAMWNHIPRMWGKMQEESIAHVAISEGEMADVFAYLAFVKALDEPGSAVIGQRLLRDKRCGYCHSLSSQKAIGPDLRRWGRYRNPAVWAQLMLEHAPGMVREMGARGVAAQKLEPRELVDIITYIGSLSPTGEAELLEPGDPAEGERIFRAQKCIQCHSVGGLGGQVGPRLGYPGWVTSFTGAAVKVWNGAAKMRATMGTMGVRAPVLTPQDVAHVIAYLFAASYAEAPGVPEQGTRLLQEKGCTRCHEAGTGPSFEHFRGRASPVTLAQALWMHGPTMLERMRDLGIRWPSFTGDEVRHLAAALNAP